MIDDLQSFVSNVCPLFIPSKVALVVKKGICTFVEKAEYASRYINPPGEYRCAGSSLQGRCPFLFLTAVVLRLQVL
jgi:hypothetical protein